MRLPAVVVKHLLVQPRPAHVQEGARTAMSAQWSAKILGNTRTRLSALLRRDSWNAPCRHGSDFTL